MASGWMTRLLDSGTEGTLALALALGHELGIFDIIMASQEPLTIQDIAEKGNLKERYVQEWLGCMVAGEVIEAKRGNPERYFIAEDHKGAMDQIGVVARMFAACAVRYDAVKACFKKAGPYGVNHGDFPDVFNMFHVLRKSTAVDIAEAMVSMVDGLAEKLDKGIDVLDLGCGTGVLVIELARRWPNSRFHGSDISPQGLDIARQQMADSGLTNATFSCDDLFHLPAHYHNQYDWVFTYDVIHDLPQPVKALNEISQCLKSGAVYVMGDIHTPQDRCRIAGDNASMCLYGLSTFLCLPASAGEGGELGPGAAWSIEEAQNLISHSELELVHSISNDAYFAYLICRKRGEAVQSS